MYTPHRSRWEVRKGIPAKLRLAPHYKQKPTVHELTKPLIDTWKVKKWENCVVSLTSRKYTNANKCLLTTTHKPKIYHGQMPPIRHRRSGTMHPHIQPHNAFSNPIHHWVPGGISSSQYKCGQPQILIFHQLAANRLHIFSLTR